MPLDPGLSDQEKGQICATYDDAERASRIAAGPYAFYIPPRIMDRWFRRALGMIDRLEPVSGWEDHLFSELQAQDPTITVYMDPGKSRYGSFCLVYWEPRLETWEDAEETPPPAGHVQCLKKALDTFSCEFGLGGELRNGIETFYIHYVDDGRLDDEIRLAKEAV